MQEFVDERFMLLTRMSILAMCARMKFKVLGVGDCLNVAGEV
jgi:hypothetical protein